MVKELEDELVINLRRAVNVGDLSYSELRLREPTGDEVVQVEALTGTAADIMAISLISGVPRSAVAQIGARDIIQGAEYIGAFMREGQYADTGEELTFTFRAAVKVGEQAFTEMRLREPTGEEMIKMEALKGMAGNLFDLALISGLPKAAIGRLGVSDITRGAAFLASFMKGAQTTGAP